MQGRKDYQEKLFIRFQLSDYVPEDNFYRQLKKILDLNFLYNTTSLYYGKEGQKSIAPVVFMRLILVGYLENLNSDRRIITSSRMRMDILYFLGYDLDEGLPWHSTLSRTRKLYGEEHFTALFKQVLKLCINEGLITGKRQAIDSVLVRANASINSMIEKQVMEDVDAFNKELDASVEEEKQNVVAEKNDDFKRSYPTNKTHYSPADPDARLTTKPGKPINLYYRGQICVDTESHFITYAQACKGNKADNTCLPELLTHTIANMQENHIRVEEIVADSGYSSGVALQSLIDNNVVGYIPSPGNYMRPRDETGFTYDANNDWYTCTQGIHLIFKRTEQNDKKANIRKRVYQSSIKDCKNCSFKDTCVNARGFKKIAHSIDKPLYDTMQQKMETDEARRLMRLRSSTVEPVIGSLVNYTGIKRINTKGIKQANKCLIMAAVAYNLKKFIKRKPTPSKAVA